MDQGRWTWPKGWRRYGLWIGISLIWGLSWLPVVDATPLPALAQASLDAEPEITDEQIKQFAQVVLEMEPFRVEAYEQAEQTEDPDRKDEIRREFIRKATEIITSSGLTVTDYNRITLKIRSDDGKDLKQEIEAEILAIQQGDNSSDLDPSQVDLQNSPLQASP